MSWARNTSIRRSYSVRLCSIPFNLKRAEPNAPAGGAREGVRLVEDARVLGMIRERLGEPDTRRGFILDGFPRNLAQAHALERMLEALQQPLDAVVQLEVDYRELVRRISGRRTCADCGRVFNMLTSPPASSESCPRTGAPHRLMQRPDDNEATVAERLRVYDEKTRPLIDFYRARGLLRVIDAAGDVDEVTRRLARALGAPLRALRGAKRRAHKGAGARPTHHKPTRKRAARQSPGKIARRKRAVARKGRAVGRGKARRATPAGRGRLKGRPRWQL